MAKSIPNGRRIANVPDALAYGKKLCGGRFSRTTLYRLVRRKKIIAYQHLSRMLIDLDSIDRYVKSLPLVEYPPRNHDADTEERG